MQQAKTCLVCNIPFYSVFALFLYIGVNHAIRELVWLTVLYYVGLLGSLKVGYTCCKYFSSTNSFPQFAAVLQVIWLSIFVPVVPLTAAILCSKYHGPSLVLCYISEPNPFLYAALLVYANGKTPLPDVPSLHELGQALALTVLYSPLSLEYPVSLQRQKRFGQCTPCLKRLIRCASCETPFRDAR